MIARRFAQKRPESNEDRVLQSVSRGREDREDDLHLEVDDAALRLTADEKRRAVEIFRKACVKANTPELDVAAFSICVNELMEEATQKAIANGEQPAPMPSEADLKAAFELADTDRGGTVDHDEFLVLYAKVKAGEVNGIGGGFFSLAFSLFSSPIAKVTLTAEEKRRAIESFRAACVKAKAPELNFTAFSICMKELMQEARQKAIANGEQPPPMPTKADLKAAFATADANHNGTVDRDEFVELYRSVKASEASSGNGGGFFSAAFSVSSPLSSVIPFGGAKQEESAEGEVRQLEEDGHKLSIREKIALRRNSGRDEQIFRRLSESETADEDDDGSQKEKGMDKELESKPVPQHLRHVLSDRKEHDESRGSVMPSAPPRSQATHEDSRLNSTDSLWGALSNMPPVPPSGGLLRGWMTSGHTQESQDFEDGTRGIML